MEKMNGILTPGTAELLVNVTLGYTERTIQTTKWEDNGKIDCAATRRDSCFLEQQQSLSHPLIFI